MKCPHCQVDAKALTVETRQHEGATYRRRSCGRCGKSFVTQEQAPAGLKMPAPVRDGRARGVLPKAPPAARPLKAPGAAAHLQEIWK